jgi:multisubunit Na+/H+ antiporter MnhB subunit
MNLNPIKPLTDAITFPFTFLYVVGLCLFINWFTSPGVWWVQWVAFGMGIALITIWFRAFKFLLATVGIAAIGYFIYRWWKNRQTMAAAPAIETALVETRAAGTAKSAKMV